VICAALLGGAPTVAAAADACEVQSSTLTWGFKESFRSYISGSIANGQWTVADGATYETPSFGWTDGQGTFDRATGTLAFTGSITFTGHGGILNTTVANPEIRFVDGQHAVLLVDVSGTTQQGAQIDEQQVEFVDLDLAGAITSDAATVSVTDAAATLTAAGAEAFGTYQAGEQFDPITLTLTVDPACATIPAPSPTWWVWVFAGVAGLVAAAVVVALVLRRRRA